MKEMHTVRLSGNKIGGEIKSFLGSHFISYGDNNIPDWGNKGIPFFSGDGKKLDSPQTLGRVTPAVRGLGFNNGRALWRLPNCEPYTRRSHLGLITNIGIRYETIFLIQQSLGAAILCCEQIYEEPVVLHAPFSPSRKRELWEVTALFKQRWILWP